MKIFITLIISNILNFIRSLCEPKPTTRHTNNHAANESKSTSRRSKVHKHKHKRASAKRRRK